jgi:hypothetical protein
MAATKINSRTLAESARMRHPKIQRRTRTILSKAAPPANDSGWFFTRGGFSPDGETSGTDRMQGGVLLHELGHATGALLPDAEGMPDAAKNQAMNDSAIKQHCSKTLNALSNK